jgi:methionine aminotransferase
MTTPAIQTRLPAVGTTVFTLMSALASEHGAVNLGQGFPDFGCDPALLDQVNDAMRAGHNQYPMMAGAPPLRAAIAAKIGKLYGHEYDADSEITVTAGATQALTTAILCCVHPGDEVIVIEPAYDSYLPAITLAGGVPVTVSMQVGERGYSVPWDQVAAAVTPRTRLIIVNTPHNPTGSILRRADLEALAAIVDGSDVLVLSDEVYEHMVYDGQQHESVSRHPVLAERAFVVSSFGKTYHVTGWKVGYVAAPAPLPAFYQRKRDLFREGLARTRFTLLPADGTYFQCVRYDAISPLPEAGFAQWLTTEIKVAAIPVSAFYSHGKESGIVRFCFAKQDETLRLALERLANL